ncbi:MAG: hypothetical protein ACJ72T_04555 [Nitrososphaeraceae archaeon]
MLKHDGIKEQKQNLHLSFGVQSVEINCNSVDIDLAKIEESHWAFRSIKEALNNGKSSVVMDGNELLDFLRCAKGSYGIHTEHIDGCRRQFCMYLSFKDDKNNDL